VFVYKQTCSGAFMSLQALPAPGKQLFHYLFAQASLGIAVEDLEGKLLLVNPVLCSMLGYREDQLCGMHCSDFANPKDSEDDWALFQQLSAGAIDRYSLEKRYVRKDGVQFWGRLNVSLWRDGDGGESPLVFAFVEDITDRKLSELAIASVSRRLIEAQSGNVSGSAESFTTTSVNASRCWHRVTTTPGRPFRSPRAHRRTPEADC
jgi:PAS domain S-box-containing protein